MTDDRVMEFRIRTDMRGVRMLEIILLRDADGFRAGLLASAQMPPVRESQSATFDVAALLSRFVPQGLAA